MQPLSGRRSATAMSNAPDRPVPFHAIADSPADDAARVEVEDDSQIEPAFAGPDVAYITM